MVSSFRKIWTASPVIVRATLLAAWSASKVGTISLAALFTTVNLAFGIYGIAEGHMKIAELPGVVVGGAAVFVLSLLFSFVITIPVSSVIATCAYPFLHTLRAADERAFGVVGFLVGALIWLGLWWTGPTGNLYFGSWISVFVVGGVAGCAGGIAFAQQFNRGHQQTSGTMRS
jgi:hypothetical protein